MFWTGKDTGELPLEPLQSLKVPFVVIPTTPILSGNMQ